VNAVADEFRKQMAGDVKNLLETISACRELVKKQRNDRTEFGDKIDTVEKKICDRVEHLKQQIEKEKLSLLKELASCKKDRMKQIDTVVGEIEQHMSFAESLVKYTEELQKKGAASDIAQQSNTLHDRAAELQKLDVIHQTINTLGSLEVIFSASTWPPVSSSSVVGKIHQQCFRGEYFRICCC
jgi:hypothetical protein